MCALNRFCEVAGVAILIAGLSLAVIAGGCAGGGFRSASHFIGWPERLIPAVSPASNGRTNAASTWRFG